eukprot:gene42666-52926_t
MAAIIRACQTRPTHAAWHGSRPCLANRPIPGPYIPELVFLKEISMLSLLGTLLVGLVVGLIARAVKPGDDKLGWIMTALLGVAGSFLASYVGAAMGWYAQGAAAGWFASVGTQANAPYQASSALDERMNLLLVDSPGGTNSRFIRSSRAEL